MRDTRLDFLIDYLILPDFIILDLSKAEIFLIYRFIGILSAILVNLIEFIVCNLHINVNFTLC